MLIIFALTLCGLWSTAAGAAGTVASDLIITDPVPATLSWLVAVPKSVTYSVTLVVTDGGVATTSITAFFSNADDSTMSTPVTASGTVTSLADATAITGIIAALTLDATNCDVYTKICTTLAGPESKTCTDFGSTVGVKYCSAFVAATAFAVTLPDPTGIKYSTTAATVVTFSLTITEAAGLAGSLTAINLYFSDNAQFDVAVKKSDAVLATPTSDLPMVIAATDGLQVAGSTASLMPDAANCDSYTHLCVVITVAADSGDTADDDFCIPLTAVATGAGVTDCPADENGLGMNKGSYYLVLPLVISAMYAVITY